MNGCDSDHSHTDLCMTDDAPLDNVTLRHSTVSRGDVTVEQKRTFLTTTETHRAIQEHEAILWTSSRSLLDDGILQWSTWAVDDPVQLVSVPSSWSLHLAREHTWLQQLVGEGKCNQWLWCYASKGDFADMVFPKRMHLAEKAKVDSKHWK